MPVYQVCLILFIASIGGWLINSAYLFFLFRPQNARRFFGPGINGVLPGYKARLAKSIATFVSDNYLHKCYIEEKVDYTTVVQQLKPQIEHYIDGFVANKLPLAFPMLFNLVGEKTLAKFRVLFMEEVENSLPTIIKEAGDKFLQDGKLSVLMEKAILEVPMDKLRKCMQEHDAKLFNRFRWIGAAGGFTIGLLQCAVLSFF